LRELCPKRMIEEGQLRKAGAGLEDKGEFMFKAEDLRPNSTHLGLKRSETSHNIRPRSRMVIEKLWLPSGTRAGRGKKL